jgi:hypothetical protein
MRARWYHHRGGEPNEESNPFGYYNQKEYVLLLVAFQKKSNVVDQEKSLNSNMSVYTEHGNYMLQYSLTFLPSLSWIICLTASTGISKLSRFIIIVLPLRVLTKMDVGISTKSLSLK